MARITARAAKLGQSELVDASISSVKMQAVNAKHADFSLARITVSDFSTVEQTQPLACGGADIHSRTSDFTQAFFQDGSLTGVKFAGARLDVADFSSALLSDVDFTAATGSDLSFDSATIDSTVFDRASLIRSDFSNAKIGRSTFDDANLAGSNFASVRFLDIESERALERASDLSRVNISGTIFSSPGLVCRLIRRGAVLVTDYSGWSDAGRPAYTWKFASEEDRDIIRKCRDGHRRAIRGS
jgi:uncharacterized protein YjbI with pentapeptide repeats